MQFLPHPARLESGPNFGRGISRKPAEYGFGGHHPRFHRCMTALDFGDIEEPGRIANQPSTGKIEPRDGLKAALIERAGAIGNPSAAFKEGLDRRMRLEALELF